MRVRRALAAGLLALACGTAMVILAIPALAATAAPVYGTVSVDPQFGPGNTTITAVFQLNPPDSGCPGFDVIFKWDGRNVGQDKLNGCAASVSFKPPRDDRQPGPHRVTVWDTHNHRLSVNAAVFLIASDPSSPPPTLSSTPVTPGSTKASKSPKATPTDTSYTTDPPLPTYDGPSVAGTVAAIDTGTGAGADTGSGGEGGGGLSGAMGVALTFGGALVLGGVLILGYIVMRGRRGDGDPEYALADSPTQPLPRHPGGLFGLGDRIEGAADRPPAPGPPADPWTPGPPPGPPVPE
jgi:hypothetical protein